VVASPVWAVLPRPSLLERTHWTLERESDTDGTSTGPDPPAHLYQRRESMLVLSYCSMCGSSLSLRYYLRPAGDPGADT